MSRTKADKKTEYFITGYKVGHEGNTHPSGELFEDAEKIFEYEGTFIEHEIKQAFEKGADLVLVARAIPGTWAYSMNHKGEHPR